MPFRWSISCWMHTASKPVGGQRRSAVEIEVMDDDPLGALDLVVDAGHRQAAFLANLFAFGRDRRSVDHAPADCSSLPRRR